MDAKAFLAEFGHIASAPEGVKRLREMVLQFAVQGRLVPQDATDEPASELLRRIELVRRTSSTHTKTTKRGRQAGLAVRSAAAEPSHYGPYPVPSRWSWARFDMVATIASNLVDPKAHKELPHIAPDNIEKGTGRLLPYRTIAEDGVTSANHAFFAGQILYSKIRPNLAKAVVIDFDGLCSADMYPIVAHIDPRYLLIYMLSPLFISLSVRRDTRVAMPKINQIELARIPVPVAPLCEQHRIVAKVDELMALCDELEAKQQKRERLRVLTSVTALDALTSASGSEELENHWSRIAENFGQFYDRPETVGKLRAAIPQLAVQGKLVARDSGDGPAREAICRALDTGEIATGGMAAMLWAFAGESTETPFDAPPGWEWIPTGTAGDVKLGRQRSPKHHTGPSMRPYLRVANVFEARIDTTDIKEMNFTDTEFGRFRLESGDLLLNEGQSYELVGRPAIYRGDVPGACFQNTLIRFRPFSFAMSEWALIVFRAYLWNGRFRQEVKQTTNMAHLSASRLSAIEFPVPPLAEQGRIVGRVHHLLAICDELEARLSAGRNVAEKLSLAAVATLTGTRIEDKQEMKAPKTELVSKLRLLNSPSAREHAPLAAILVRNNGELSAKALWNASGLEIDEFYRQLRVEMANDWIEEPEAAYVREVEVA